MITRDPLDGVSGTTTVANPYHYGDNSPLNKTDPSGMRTNEAMFARYMLPTTTCIWDVFPWCDGWNGKDQPSPTTPPTTPPTPEPAGPMSSDPVIYAMQFLTRTLSYPAHTAAALVGHFMYESGGSTQGSRTHTLNVAKSQIGGPGWGIGQWDETQASGFRLTLEKNFAKSIGANWEDIDTQLRFVDHELSCTGRNDSKFCAGDFVTSVRNRIFASTSIEENVRTIMRYYGSPNDPRSDATLQLGVRIENAYIALYSLAGCATAC